MSDLQSLKKQFRGIRSSQKLTKAMKTISTAKFAKLSALYNGYSEYGSRCRAVYEQYRSDYLAAVAAVNPDAPSAVVVMASNKGLCGSFNSELLNFALPQLRRQKGALLFACGKKAIAFFQENRIPVEKEIVFSDIPDYAESAALLDDLLALRRSGRISRVYVIYPQYTNMMVQTPAIRELFPDAGAEETEPPLLVPDRDTVVTKTADVIFRAALHALVLETAVGAQAATLMTMRSAYDTATEYCEELEGEINRKRQSIVTADVLETAAEWS